VFVEYPVSPRVVDIAQRCDVVIVEYRLGTLEPVFINTYHSSTLKWIFYYSYLKEYSVRRKYDKILFASVTDLAFLSDPFLALPLNSSYAFQEGGFTGVPISQSGLNSGWIKDCFGVKMLSGVQGSFILYSSVLLTSFSSGMVYLKLVNRILLGKSEIGGLFPQCEREGADQAVHNVIIHLGLIDNIEIKSDINFPIANLQSNEQLNAQGTSLSALLFVPPYNPQGIREMPVSMLYRYDHVSSISLELARKYIYWKSYDDQFVLWRNSLECRHFHTRLGPDIFQGQGDINRVRVISADQCCGICLRTISPQRCKSFSYIEGSCFLKTCDQTSSSNTTVLLMNEVRRSQSDWFRQQAVAERILPINFKLSAFVD
jgi:hypothetical protein